MAEEQSPPSIDLEQSIAEAQNDNGDHQVQGGFELGVIKVRSEYEYPINLDIAAEIRNILASGMFHNLESPTLYDKLCHMMLSERYCKMVEALFWTIFVVKFQKDDVVLLEKLRKQLGRLYSEYFSLLQQPKEELSNLGIMGSAYICHVIFFYIFPGERKNFDMRFILDCYHIVIHEINGVFVSDSYIQTYIERIFGNKFFHFEKRVQKKKKVEKKDFRNEPLLRHLVYDFKDLPQVEGGLELATEISMKLRRSPKKLKAAMNESEVEEPKPHVEHTTTQILQLTQPPEDHITTVNSPKSPSYFPRVKFNCHQVSPTVSAFLENSTQSLPYQKKKIIHYSNSKPERNVLPVHFSPRPEPESEVKFEKKDKNRLQLKGSLSDYKLGNRPEDYYLGYMPKDTKKKYRFELDMKYMLDNVRPKIRGSYSPKGLSEDLGKKALQNPPHLNLVPLSIPEEPEESRRKSVNELKLIKEETDTVDMPLEKKSPRREKKDETMEIGSSFRGFKSFDDGIPEQGLPVIKMRTKLKDETPISKQGSLTKKSTVFPKIEDESSSFREASDKRKKVVEFSPNLKFSSAANNKLGKGRYFVDLAEPEDPDQVKYGKNNFPDKFKYADRRQEYISEHDETIRKDVDANIENLIDLLKAKKTSLHRSLNKQVLNKSMK